MNWTPIIIQRMTLEDGKEDDVTDVADGELVYYDAMQHFYKEAREHGLTLAEAIEAMERQNGA